MLPRKSIGRPLAALKMLLQMRYLFDSAISYFFFVLALDLARACFAAYSLSRSCLLTVLVVLLRVRVRFLGALLLVSHMGFSYRRSVVTRIVYVPKAVNDT